MKKLFFLMLACCTGSFGAVNAANTDISGMANVIYIEPFSAPQGASDFEVPIKMKNAAIITAFQLKLQLPEGMTPATYTATGIIKCSLAGDRLVDGDDHSISISQQEDGNYIVLSNSNNNLSFTGNDGVIATLKVNISSGMALGDYPVVITYQKLNETEMSKFYEPGEVETTLTITEPEDGRLKFDENSTSLPAYTAGEKADVTMKRTINAGDWSTIVLPFTLPKAKAEAVFGSDAEYYKFSSYETTVDVEGDLKPTAIKINFTKYELANTLSAIAGGQPYLIKTKKNITEIRADGVKLVGAVTPTTGKDVNYEDVLEGKFTGTFVKTTIPANGLFISENKFWYSNGSTNVKAFRAWFELDAVLNQTIELSRITMNFDDGEPTGIQTNNRDTITNDRYYDLQGRSVQTPAKKGLYINNGKKMVVK